MLVTLVNSNMDRWIKPPHSRSNCRECKTWCSEKLIGRRPLFLNLKRWKNGWFIRISIVTHFLERDSQESQKELWEFHVEGKKYFRPVLHFPGCKIYSTLWWFASTAITGYCISAKACEGWIINNFRNSSSFWRDVSICLLTMRRRACVRHTSCEKLQCQQNHRPNAHDELLWKGDSHKRFHLLQPSCDIHVHFLHLCLFQSVGIALGGGACCRVHQNLCSWLKFSAQASQASITPGSLKWYQPIAALSKFYRIFEWFQMVTNSKYSNSKTFEKCDFWLFGFEYIQKHGFLESNIQIRIKLIQLSIRICPNSNITIYQTRPGRQNTVFFFG